MTLLDFVKGAHVKILRPSGGCHVCPRKRVDFVPPALRKGAILFLGESPGEHDVAAGEPLAGQSGNYLRRLAKEAGVPEPWSFSATVHCRVPDGVAPKPKEVQCCLAQFTLEEIRGYSIVVLCGNVPLQALFPDAKADHFRGNVAWHPDFPGTRFYAIYHPSYILRRPDLEGEYEQQLRRLARIAKGEPEPAWKLVRGTDALTAVRKILEAPLISLDFETNRLESWASDGRIKSLAVTADAKTVAVAHEDEPQFAPMLKMIADYLAKPEKSVVGSHIAFDLEWLERETGKRVRCQLIHELAVQYYHARQYQQPSLKELVSKELDGYRYLIHHPHEMKDVELLLRYNAEDVVHPLHLMRKAVPLLKPRTLDLTTRVLGPVSLVLQRMTATGIYLREDYRREKLDEYREKRRAVIAEWKAEDPEFIPSEHEAGDGLIRYLYTVRGLPVLARTESGQPSTDKSTLKQLQRDGHTIVRHRLALSEIDKIESTYLTAYDKHVWPDSRVRSSYTLTWTDSGRSSSRSPNLQNIPRKKEIRNLFGVPAGHALIESDLSQVEFRIMVCLAKDENGIAGYMRGDDAHTMTARNIVASGLYANPTKEQVAAVVPSKEQRSDAKPVNFMFLYGGQASTAQKIAADDYGVVWSDEQAERFRSMFMATYPRIEEYHGASRQKLIANRGWFESVTGHVFHYRDWDAKDRQKQDHAFRAALNAEAQGPAAHLCFYIMVLARRLLDARGMQSVEFVNTVHDSILCDVPKLAWVPDVIATIEEARAQAHEWVKHWFIVPFLMEHAVGESWGALKEFKVG